MAGGYRFGFAPRNHVANRWLAMVVLALCGGCGVLRPGIPGSGIRQSELRSVAGFDEVALAGFGTVEVYPGDTSSVRVTTDDNLVQHVETEVADGVLQIKPGRPINPRTGLRVEVTTPSLRSARVSGAGEMHLRGVAADALDLAISGAGTMTAEGQARSVTAAISGVGEADLQALYAEDACVRISGAGEASVYAAQSIDAQISGVGDVVCYGNPTQVAQQISGVGELTIEPSASSPIAPVHYTLSDAQGAAAGSGPQSAAR